MKILILSTYPPRKCGIATFTWNLVKHLRKNLSLSRLGIIAINDSHTQEIHSYGEDVVWVMDQSKISSYSQTAEFVNQSDYPFLHIQHEFGIYGGRENYSIFELVENLTRPFLVTFHSVPPEPEEWERRILEKIHKLSSFTIVQSRKAVEILESKYGGEGKKIVYIPHGVPRPPLEKREEWRRKWGWEEKFVLLTFGLLNPRKGLEDLIRATSMLYQEFPQIFTVILGRPHPRFFYFQGRPLTQYLLDLAEEKGVRDRVYIPGTYLSEDDLLSALVACDVVITPYRRVARGQIVSGVLSYALGCGKAVVSTPYLHAEELLSRGAGLLVEFDNPESLAQGIRMLLKNPEKLLKMEKKARELGENFYWDVVARRYGEVYRWMK